MPSLCQVAASTLFGICQRIGADLTALHILPKLKELFDELAFSQEISKGSTTVGRNLKVGKIKIGGDLHIESRMDLVWVSILLSKVGLMLGKIALLLFSGKLEEL